MKKRIILFLMVTICLFGCSMSNEKKCTNNDIGIKKESSVKYEIKNANLLLENGRQETISNSELNKLKKYKLNSIISDDFNIESHEYIGIKLLDLVNKYSPDNYNRIIIYGKNSSIEVDFNTMDTTDYLIFNTDGKDLNNIIFADFSSKTYQWLDNVNKISFIKGED